MRWLLVVALLVACLSAMVPSDLGARPAAAPGPRVTIFGDSVADSLEYVPDAMKILSEGIDLRLELSPCRKLVPPGCAYMGTHPRSVLDIVQSAAPGDLGNIAIVDVGYNDPPNNYETDMAPVADALVARGVAHILWVTMREQNDGYHQINTVIRAQAPRWPQLEIVDWDAASRGKDWFNGDGIHLNAAGAVGFATLVRPYVLAACGSACIKPSAGPRPPANARAPGLRGTAVVGHTLICTRGSWTGAKPIVFSYRWVRNGKVLARMHEPVRRLVAADRGRHVACRVWAANVGGAVQATSAARLIRAHA